ncbi:MAG: S1 RNA-binding domain-containing protein, partial [Faecalibacillus sp.]
GFLRILDGNHPLDATAIHPDNYLQAEELLKELNLSFDDLGTDKLKEKILKIDKKEVIERLKIDQYTLDDIIESLIKPHRSIRDEYQTPLLKKDILHIEDLKEGMMLEGTVRNVVDFGAFIDIGLKNDGLVHISKMSHERIKHPLDVLSVGDIVEVKVIDINIDKKRVGLSMI